MAQQNCKKKLQMKEDPWTYNTLSCTLIMIEF